VRIQNSINIAAPVARIWELTLAVETWPQHNPTMTSIERLDTGPLGIGSQARVKQRGQRARVWTVTALEPEKVFAWSTKSRGLTMTAIHTMRTSEIGTTNTLAIEIEGVLASPIGALVRRPIARAISQENNGLKAAAER